MLSGWCWRGRACVIAGLVRRGAGLGCSREEGRALGVAAELAQTAGTGGRHSADRSARNSRISVTSRASRSPVHRALAHRRPRHAGAITPGLRRPPRLRPARPPLRPGPLQADLNGPGDKSPEMGDLRAATRPTDAAADRSESRIFFRYDSAIGCDGDIGSPRSRCAGGTRAYAARRSRRTDRSPGCSRAWRDGRRRGTGCLLRLGLRFDIEVSGIGPDRHDEVAQEALEPPRPNGCGATRTTSSPLTRPPARDIAPPWL